MPDGFIPLYHFHDHVRILMPRFRDSESTARGPDRGGMEARAYVPPASPSAGFTISRNGPLPFEHDGRRKLYDRPPPPANGPLALAILQIVSIYRPRAARMPDGEPKGARRERSAVACRRRKRSILMGRNAIVALQLYV